MINTDDCWLFAGTTNYAGYGIIRARINGVSREFRAHRLVYEAIRGKIPDGLVLDHLCKITNCVNPYHLEAVTNQENILRGISPTARNRRKTHCPHGHEYTPDNIIWCVSSKYKSKYRKCRKCFNRWQNKYRQRKRIA